MKPSVTKCLIRALDALPGEPEDIARFLAEQDIVGYQNQPDSCPIANYLYKTCEVSVRVEANDLYALVIPGQRYHSHVTDLPPGVAAFVSRFDKLDFPELVVTSE